MAARRCSSRSCRSLSVLSRSCTYVKRRGKRTTTTLGTSRRRHGRPSDRANSAVSRVTTGNGNIFADLGFPRQVDFWESLSRE